MTKMTNNLQNNTQKTKIEQHESPLKPGGNSGTGTKKSAIPLNTFVSDPISIYCTCTLLYIHCMHSIFLSSSANTF